MTNSGIWDWDPGLTGGCRQVQQENDTEEYKRAFQPHKENRMDTNIEYKNEGNVGVLAVLVAAKRAGFRSVRQLIDALLEDEKKTAPYINRVYEDCECGASSVETRVCNHWDRK